MNQLKQPRQKRSPKKKPHAARPASRPVALPKYLLAGGLGLALSGAPSPLLAQDAPPAPNTSPGTPPSTSSGASGQTPATAAGDAAVGGVVTPEVPTGLLPANPLATPPPPVDPAPGLGDARLAESEAGEELGIIEAIALALRDNPSRKEARFALEAARQRIGTARLAGGPQVSASADVSGQRGFFGGGTGTSTGGGVSNPTNPTDPTNPNNGGTGTNSGSTFLGFNDSASLGVNASVPVYTGGRVKAATRVADANARAQAARVLQVDQELVLQVSLGYLDVLRTDQLLRVAESNLAVSRERRRVAGVRFDAGAAARLEVLRADTILADAQQSRVAAVNTLAQSRAAINTLLGRSPETPFRPQSLASLALQFGGTLSLPSGALGLDSITPSTSAIPGLPVPDASGSTSTSGAAALPNTGSTTANPATANTTAPNAGGVASGAGTAGGAGATAPNVTAPGQNVPGAVSGNTGAAGSGVGTATGTGSVPGVSTPGVTAPGAGGATVGTAPGTTSSGTVLTNPAGTGGASTGASTGTAGVGAGAGVDAAGSGAAGGVGGGASLADAASASSLGQAAGIIAGQSGAALRASAGTSRQSLAVTQAQIEAALAAVDVARAQRRPNVDLSVSGFLRNPASFLGRFILGIGLGVAQNVFDSGRTRSQIREAQATVEQLRQGLAGQQLSVAQQIEQSLLALDSAQRRQASADVAVVAAAEALRAAQLGFEAGATTNLEVTDAQTALLSSQITSINTRFDVVQAQATLAATIGITTPEVREAYRRAVDAEAARINALPIGDTQTVQAPPKKRRKFLGIF